MRNDKHSLQAVDILEVCIKIVQPNYGNVADMCMIFFG